MTEKSGRTKRPADRPAINRSKRKATLGKGWAFLQFMAYLEWCEAADERGESDMAIIRALLPVWAKDGLHPVSQTPSLGVMMKPEVANGKESLQPRVQA